MGTILGMVVVSHAVAVGTMCEESERHVYMGLLHPTFSHTNSRCLLATFTMPKKRERRKDIFRIQIVLLLFPSRAMAERDLTAFHVT
jgi:hypothetical protein